jgi:hypothetical protein
VLDAHDAEAFRDPEDATMKDVRYPGHGFAAGEHLGSRIVLSQSKDVIDLEVAIVPAVLEWLLPGDDILEGFRVSLEVVNFSGHIDLAI